MTKIRYKSRSEYVEQCAVFKWAALYAHKWPGLWLLNGSMMGVNLHKVARARAKKAGVKRGKPDINLPVACGGFHSLWIELKKEHGGTLKAWQREWLENLAKAGNYAVCCHGSEAAIITIERYITGQIENTGRFNGIPIIKSPKGQLELC